MRRGVIARAVTACLLAVAILTTVQPASAHPMTIVAEADWILSMQVKTGPDAGLIEANAGQSYCVPYFSSMAASGLAAATQFTGDPKYVRGAWAWLDWYAAHMDVNGFVNNYRFFSGRWLSTGGGDSTDAYAGAFLTAIRDAYVASGDDAKLAAMWPFVRKATDAMLATSDGRFMTYAKPDYPQLFLMDNVEVYEGFRALEYLAGAPHPDAVLRETASRWTAGMVPRFEEFWDVERAGYDVAIGFDGIRYRVDWQTLYPAITAQAWFLRTGLVPAPRAAALAQKIDQVRPSWDRSGLQSGEFWWPEIVEAMRFAGDSARAESGLTSMLGGIASTNRLWPYHVGNAGRLIQQMIGSPDTVPLSSTPAFRKPGDVTVAMTGVPGIVTGGSLTYECRIDGGPYLACPSTVTQTVVTPGRHTIDAHAVDSSGALDVSPVSISWTVDSTPPAASFSTTPPEPGSAQAPFSFTGSDDLSPASLLTYECATDGASYTPCSSPAVIRIAGTGSHSILLRAIDPAGNVGVPISHTWFADATPPTSSIVSGPSGTQPTGNATFTFSGSDDAGPVTFECRIGSASFTPCVSPHAITVGEGTFAFQVRAVDAVGNVDPSPPVRFWNVDRTPPNTLIVESPVTYSRLGELRFSFIGADNIPGSLTYECALDAGAFTRCSPPVRYQNVADGTHSFQVRATDGAGYTDPTAARWDGIIDRVVPSGKISTPTNTLLLDLPPLFSKTITGLAIDDRSGVATVSVRFAPAAASGQIVDMNVPLQCSDATRLSCTWSLRAPVGTGRYRVSATLTDRAGNVSASGSPIDVFIIG